MSYGRKMALAATLENEVTQQIFFLRVIAALTPANCN